MLTALFAVLMLLVFGELLWASVKLAWSFLPDCNDSDGSKRVNRCCDTDSRNCRYCGVNIGINKIGKGSQEKFLAVFFC